MPQKCQIARKRKALKRSDSDLSLRENEHSEVAEFLRILRLTLDLQASSAGPSGLNWNFWIISVVVAGVFTILCSLGVSQLGGNIIQVKSTIGDRFSEIAKSTRFPKVNLSIVVCS